MADLQELPLEMRALVRFFEEDDRPSAVFEVEDGGEVKHWHKNQALKELGNDCDEEELKRVLDAVQPGEDTGVAKIAVVEGRVWNLRALGGKWRALVRRGKAKDTASEEETHANGAVVSDKQANGAGKKEYVDPLDWTRFEVPGLSPWTEFIRTFDWASTGLGHMDTWSSILRSAIVHMMLNPSPRLLIWGDKMTFVYNEACVPLFGNKHPRCLGLPVSEAWSEIWDNVGHIIQDAYNGKVTSLKWMALPIIRNGFLEETFWDFTLLPIMSPEDGTVVGMMDEISESTGAMRSERRRTSVLKLSDYISSAASIKELWSTYLAGVEYATEDAAFACLYSVVNDDDNMTDSTSSMSDSLTLKSRTCVLEGTVGISADHEGIPQTFALYNDEDLEPGIVKACREACKSGKISLMTVDDGTLPDSLTTPIPGRGFDDKIRSVLVAPINSHMKHEVLGVVVIGLNPRSPYDSEYALWAALVFDLLGKAASLVSLPEEQRKAQKIADDINTSLAQQLRTTTLMAERSEEKFSRMAASAPVGMFVFDAGGNPLYLNDAYIAIFGDSREEHMGRYNAPSVWSSHYIHEDDLEQFQTAWEGLIENKLPMSVEFRLKKPWRSLDKNSSSEISGETWLLVNAIPEIDADGAVARAPGWLIDISYSKFSEKLLNQRLEDALDNKVKTETFIDLTSHEMRNPLSAILQSADSIISFLDPREAANVDGASQSMLQEGSVANEIVEAAETIILCATHQKRIVDDILTLSKLDASLLVISPDTVQPPTLVVKALKMYEAELQRADIETKVIIEPTYAQLGVDWVILDSSRLLQVIINLLTNAIKFTANAEKRLISICVGASWEVPTGKHHGVNFIPPRHPESSHTLPSEWGEGEDLYLQIAVTDSGPGLSEDEIHTLFQRFSQASPKTYKQYGGSGLGLFISRQLCELQGGQIGVSSDVDRTTFTFFVQTKKFKENPNAPKAIRNPLPRYTSASASPTSFSRRGSEVVKSTTLTPGQEAQTTEGASLTESRQMGAKSPETAPYSIEMDVLNENEELHVLIVEDNLINQKVMSQQLRRAGCNVHVANHGLECLDFLDRSAFCSDSNPTTKNTSSSTPLSIILLDLEMPTMDGMTCIRAIRERQRAGHIQGHVPVIAVTANARSEQITVAIEAGMDRVVTKPFRIPELVPQMYELVAEVKMRRLEADIESLG